MHNELIEFHCYQLENCFFCSLLDNNLFFSTVTCIQIRIPNTDPEGRRIRIRNIGVPFFVCQMKKVKGWDSSNPKLNSFNLVIPAIKRISHIYDLGEEKSNGRSKWLTDFVFWFTVSGVVELPLVLCQEVRHRAEDLDLRKIFKYKQWTWST